MNYFYAAFVAVMLIALVFSIDSAATISAQHAMAVCQLSHSFDTCFQALNR